MAGTAAAQATLEYGLGAAHGSMSAAPATSVGGIFGGLEKLFNSAVKPNSEAGPAAKPAAPARKAAAKPTPAAAAIKVPRQEPALSPKPRWEDPAGIQTGMSYADVVRRFGPPALAITGDQGRLLTYSGQSGPLQLQVQDEIVISIQRPKS